MKRDMMNSEKHNPSTTAASLPQDKPVFDTDNIMKFKGSDTGAAKSYFRAATDKGGKPILNEDGFPVCEPVPPTP